MYLAIDIIVRLLIFTCMWIIVNCLTLVAAEKPLKCVWLSQRKREELILSRFYRDILALHTCMNIPSIHVKIHGYETVLFVGFSLISMLLVELDDQRNIRISTVALCYLLPANSDIFRVVHFFTICRDLGMNVLRHNIAIGNPVF